MRRSSTLRSSNTGFAKQTVQRVLLIRKLAPIINGVDLSKFQVGDVIRVPEAVAAMLIREGWAEAVNDDRPLTK